MVERGGVGKGVYFAEGRSFHGKGLLTAWSFGIINMTFFFGDPFIPEFPYSFWVIFKLAIFFFTIAPGGC